MKKFKSYIFIALGIVLISCEKVISVDLDTAPPKLVVDASIDWLKNTTGNIQKIKLSTSTGYYNADFPSVSGATVAVTNSANTVFTFIENPGTGEYICNNFVPVIGETYTLSINLNGETYTATDKMIGAPKIENNIVQNNEGGMAGDEIEITYYYQDNPAETNYYIFSNKNPHIAFPEYQVENDENNNGGLTSVYYSNKDLKSGEVVNIKLYGISKRYYDYFRKILNASGADTGPFSTTPTSVYGNISNQTNSANAPFGYFRLSEVSTKDYTIQ
ncbi:DUF4249 domain-containing protein [Chryseobacterium sp. JV274]|uniref:DUF4249 domain-containing protein n=1 Tax=Chryseobacterium sp. JV274 TaxID=1932669 RepID=UPI0015C2783B|nr:DUF4249 domain-containing protein [Chryseobacterium sp. JV274]CAD0218263.1 conserved protein of unknown function [Chryseobacterium sp. JV274]